MHPSPSRNANASSATAPNRNRSPPPRLLLAQPSIQYGRPLRDLLRRRSDVFFAALSVLQGSSVDVNVHRLAGLLGGRLYDRDLGVIERNRHLWHSATVATQPSTAPTKNAHTALPAKPHRGTRTSRPVRAFTLHRW